MFFGSGASALVYQMLWMRLLAVVFGVTVHAATAVLASFMAGLALGSVLAGRMADRSGAAGARGCRARHRDAAVVDAPEPGGGCPLSARADRPRRQPRLGRRDGPRAAGRRHAQRSVQPALGVAAIGEDHQASLRIGRQQRQPKADRRAQIGAARRRAALEIVEVATARWHALDQHELALGDARGRTRIKVVPRDEMIAVSNKR